ncbi:MAG TPA: septal ring lytic transglycosylase RlpA family protein [Stellaceae bacterium]|nr:septal ring lytic transglycosylase RlpA family protein [Stellaceae bacterium]
MRAANCFVIFLSFAGLGLLLTACATPHPAPAPEKPTFTEIGAASWYGKTHDGKRTADGERFNMREMTAAHRSLPFGTIVRVEDESTGRVVKVRINDRGPYEKDRIIDLSAAAGRKLGIRNDGITTVRLQVFPSDQAREAAAPREVRTGKE